MADLELDLDLIADNEEDYAAGCLVGSPPAKSSEKRPVSARRGRGGGRAGAARRGSKAPKLAFLSGASASSVTTASAEPATVDEDMDGQCRSWGPKGYLGKLYFIVSEKWLNCRFKISLKF